MSKCAGAPQKLIADGDSQGRERDKKLAFQTVETQDKIIWLEGKTLKIEMMECFAYVSLVHAVVDDGGCFF